jgi:hypothetical protein
LCSTRAFAEIEFAFMLWDEERDHGVLDVGIVEFLRMA